MLVVPVVVSGLVSVKCVGLTVAIGDRRKWGMMLSILQLAALSLFSFPSP